MDENTPATHGRFGSAAFGTTAEIADEYEQIVASPRRPPTNPSTTVVSGLAPKKQRAVKPARTDPAPRVPSGSVSVPYAYANVKQHTKSMLPVLAAQQGRPLSDLVIISVNQLIESGEAIESAVQERSGLPISSRDATDTKVPYRVRLSAAQNTWLKDRVQVTGLTMSAVVGKALDTYVEQQDS